MSDTKAANGAQQHRVHLLRLCHGGIGQRRAMCVIGAAAHKVFGHVEFDPALGVEPADDLFHLGHDFGTDAVAGEDKDGGIGHGALLRV
mgnify:CR=1 FL=1